MLLDPRSDLAESFRRWLGIDHIHHHLERQETDMAKVIDLLNNLAAQQEAVSAAQATSFHNIDVAFQELKDAIANGDASPEIQEAADKLGAGFDALQKAAEDEGKLYADADDQGGDNPPVDNGDVTDQPVDDSGR